MAGSRSIACLLLSVVAASCGSDDGPRPSRAGLTLTLPNPVEGRLVTCTGCQEPTVTVVLDFPVAVGDPQGPGGTLDRLDTVVVNATRGGEVVRNVRPNVDYAFPSTSIPGGGSLTIQGGAVFGVPPPRDEVRVTVVARATDGRSVIASAPLTVIAAAAP